MEISTDSPRITGSVVSSPEFEFWIVGKNPSDVPQPDLLTADELFLDGVLLPLEVLSLSQHSSSHNNNSNNFTAYESVLEPEADPPPAPPLFTPSSSSGIHTVSYSKILRDLFKTGDKTLEEIKERRKQRVGSAGGAAELNINIWPFSRSRSAGNASSGSWSRARATVTARRVSSAPCSRSNSRGESSKPAATNATISSSSSKRWAPSPGRVGFAGGIHLGRTNPVWKLRRKNNILQQPKEKGTTVSSGTAGGCRGAAKKGGGNAAGSRVLNFNVNTCIGYRDQVGCRGDQENKMSGTGEQRGSGGGCRSSGGNGSLFNLRTIFSKKVY